MIQRFIELGEGYSDLYELIQLAKANQHRLSHMLALHTEIEGREVISLAIVLNPTDPGDFQPIYICREGIPNPNNIPNKRYDLFSSLSNELERNIVELTVKSSNQFSEKELYYQYLIGILRMNRFIPPLQ